MNYFIDCRNVNICIVQVDFLEVAAEQCVKETVVEILRAVGDLNS